MSLHTPLITSRYPPFEICFSSPQSPKTQWEKFLTFEQMTFIQAIVEQAFNDKLPPTVQNEKMTFWNIKKAERSNVPNSC